MASWNDMPEGVGDPPRPLQAPHCGTCCAAKETITNNGRQIALLVS
jgi:hypothetical protein